MKNLPKEIQGTPLNSVQQAYLEGLFAGMKNRGLTFGDIEATPAREEKRDLSDLSFEERVKQEQHPLDSLPLLMDHARAQKAPDREGVFKFKWQGLFYLTPVKEAFMARLRIPGGQLRSFQLREIAKAAEELTSGYVQITTRSNLQVRMIEVQNAPEFLRRIQSVGLHTQGSGADNIRNITASPTAGVDPQELIDVMPLCHELGQLILSRREFYDLPRKFNVAFDGGGAVNVVEETNDIGLSAVAFPGTPEIPKGVYFRLKLGGATGLLSIAKDTGILVAPREAVEVVAALIRVYIANGNRTDRKKARLKHLLENWSLEKYIEETEKLLGRPLTKAPFLEETSATKGPAHPHMGLFPQKQEGLFYLGVGLPAGQITPRQLKRLAELSENYASGEVRLTVWQNLIIPNIPYGSVEPLKKAISKMGLDWKQSNIRSGLVACTGNAYCKYASSNTKGHGLTLVEHLEKKFEIDVPINIHLTGCPHSCAQHYIGDIGLLATKVKVSGETVEGYHIFVGGGFGPKAALGRQVFHGLSYQEVQNTVEKMVGTYLEKRTVGESFQQFTSRHDINELQKLFSNP